MSRVLDAIPYARFLGVGLERVEGRLELVLPFRQEIVGNPSLPAVHGGVLGAFLELTALMRLIDESGTDRVPKPITFSVDYLRTAGPTTTRARAELFRLGRRIANVHVVAWQDQESRPVAAGNGKFLL
ncbi:MAG: PaaI family thioesterase [bacterium]